MTPVDRAILEHGREDFRPLRELRGTIPSGTLYRHAGKLVRLGWLRKEHGLYRTTDTGLRQLAEAETDHPWDRLIESYPPLGLVPTPVHRALVELIWAAVVARQHPSRPDRHPFFAVFGGTLHWKTSLGLFVCHTLGLDPAGHVVDCGTESGKSLAVRRSGTGALVFKRELLDAPFLVLDEILTADPRVRSALGLFLSGRRVVPVENEQLTVHPVALLTLNPRPKATLEERIGLSAPQIRRGLLADLDAVALPDLAAAGERALAAARAHGPVALSAPAMDCQTFHRRIVDLTRAILVPEAHERVDVEVVVTLCTGMTAWLPQAVEAIAQVAYDLGLLAETLHWTRPGWIEPLSQVSLDSAAPPRPVSRAALPPAPAPAGSPVARTTPTFALELPPRARRAVEFPDLSLSDDCRARLVWFAVDTQRPLEEALGRLLDFYLEWQADEDDALGRLDRILKLARELEVAEVDAATLDDYLQARAALAKHGCSVEDVPEALRLIELLDALPGPSWDWAQAETEIEALGILLGAGIPAGDVEAFVARQQYLTALGFDAETADAVAAALAKAGASGDQREAVLEALVDLAVRDVTVAELEDERRALEAEIARLEADRTRLHQALKRLWTRQRTLETTTAKAEAQATALQAQASELAEDLAMGQGLRSAVCLQPEARASLAADMDRLCALKRAGRPQWDPEVSALTARLLERAMALAGALVKAAEAIQAAPSPP